MYAPEGPVVNQGLFCSFIRRFLGLCALVILKIPTYTALSVSVRQLKGDYAFEGKKAIFKRADRVNRGIQQIYLVWNCCGTCKIYVPLRPNDQCSLRVLLHKRIHQKTFFQTLHFTKYSSYLFNYHCQIFKVDVPCPYCSLLKSDSNNQTYMSQLLAWSIVIRYVKL
jgi:hypothetical protein